MASTFYYLDICHCGTDLFLLMYTTAASTFLIQLADWKDDDPVPDRANGPIPIRILYGRTMRFNFPELMSEDRDRDRVNMIKVPPRGYGWLWPNARAFTFSRSLCAMPRVILVRP